MNINEKNNTEKANLQKINVQLMQPKSFHTYVNVNIFNLCKYETSPSKLFLCKLKEQIKQLH